MNLYGYVDGEKFEIENNVEQMCAFIMKYSHTDVTITDFLDCLILNTSMGFILRCPDQVFLRHELLHVLIPMQQGEVVVPEYKPQAS